MFPDDHVRTATDFADLRRWRDQAGADIYFLQEVTSPAAINEVFPTAEGWQHCISGQFAKDEAIGEGPVCTAEGTGSIQARFSYPKPVHGGCLAGTAGRQCRTRQ